MLERKEIKPQQKNECVSNTQQSSHSVCWYVIDSATGKHFGLFNTHQMGRWKQQ